MCSTMQEAKGKGWGSLVCLLSPSVPSFFQTKCQHSVFRDLRTQLHLTKEGPWTPGISTSLSKAFPSKTQKEDKEKITKDKDSNRRVRSREAYCNVVAPFPHKK